MTPEERSLLERTYKLAEENNSILRSIRRSTRISMVMRGLYWLVIILLSFGAYYFIQPYVNAMVSLFQNPNGTATTDTSSNSSLEALRELLSK